MSAFLDQTGQLVTPDENNPLPVVVMSGYTALNNGKLTQVSYANPLPVVGLGGGGGTVTNRYAGEWDLSVGNTVPNDAADGKVYEIVGANGVYLGNELNQGDFVEFADNLQKLIVISKSNTTAQIEQIAKDSILVDLQNHTSSINAEVSYIAMTNVNNELLNSASNTYQAIYDIAYQAITTGDGNTSIQTMIEDAIRYYADSIGVGGNGGMQIHTTVQEAAHFVIANELEIGGIIDSAIQAAVNP